MPELAKLRQPLSFASLANLLNGKERRHDVPSLCVRMQKRVLKNVFEFFLLPGRIS